MPKMFSFRSTMYFLEVMTSIIKQKYFGKDTLVLEGLILISVHRWFTVSSGPFQDGGCVDVLLLMASLHGRESICSVILVFQQLS